MVAVLGLLVVPLAEAGTCTIGGAASLPPQCMEGGGYVSPSDVHMIIDGLPPGTTILLGAEPLDFFNISSNPGGSLGGEMEQFNSFLAQELTGTGLMAGYHRLLSIPNVPVQTHIGPRNPTDPVQSFDTVMFSMQGQITSDPDFDLLRVTAGNGFGLPSPGHTTLT